MKFLTPLRLDYIDGRFWRVVGEFDYGVGQGTTVVRVMDGEITDFASTPRIMWAFGFAPLGWYGKIMLIHDDLYKHGRIGDLIIDQKYADDVLLEGIKVLATERPGPRHPFQRKVDNYITGQIFYRGVRMFGHHVWDAYRRLEALAEGEA